MAFSTNKLHVAESFAQASKDEVFKRALAKDQAALKAYLGSAP